MNGDFRLGEWLVQPGLNEISLDGRSVRLEPRVMNLLTHLAARPGEVISKEELLREVWGGKFVTEDVLSTSVFELRKVLGDDARLPRFIQTVPRRGYRLIAPVTTHDATSAVLETRDVARLPSQRGAIVRVASLATALVLLVSLVAVLRLRANERVEQATNARRALESAGHLLESGDEKDLHSALRLFHEASQLEEISAEASSGIADVWIRLVEINAIRPDEGYPRARVAAQRALDLEAESASALKSSAMVKLYYDRNWSGAEAALKNAIALDPAHHAAHHGYSQLLWASGRTSEALAEVAAAIALQPESSEYHFTLGAIHYDRRDFTAATRAFRRVIELDPEHFHAQKQLLKIDMRVNGPASASQTPPALVYVRKLEESGGKPDADFLLHKLSLILNQKYVRPTLVARIYADLGDKDRAFSWLEKAWQERDGNLLFLRLDEGWEPLREDPRFADLASRVGP